MHLSFLWNSEMFRGHRADGFTLYIVDLYFEMVREIQFCLFIRDWDKVNEKWEGWLTIATFMTAGT